MFGSRACGRGFPDWGAYKSSSYRHASSLDPSSEVCDLGQRDVHKIEVFGLCYIVGLAGSKCWSRPFWGGWFRGSGCKLAGLYRHSVGISHGIIFSYIIVEKYIEYLSMLQKYVME